MLEEITIYLSLTAHIVSFANICNLVRVRKFDDITIYLLTEYILTSLNACSVVRVRKLNEITIYLLLTEYIITSVNACSLLRVSGSFMRKPSALRESSCSEVLGEEGRAVALPKPS